MEIKGDEFIKKVQLQQEREELEQKLTEIEEVEVAIGVQKPNPYETASAEQNDEQQLENIMLETTNNNEENKKKYLVLGLILVVLFLLTIIIIRLLTDSSTKDDPFTNEKTVNPIASKTNTDDSNIEENFQKIINERIKKENKSSEEKINAIEEKKVEIKKETSSITNDAIDETIKKIEEKKIETEKIEAKKVIKKEAPKKVVEKKTIKDLMKDSSTTVPKGYFVQIGAFSKKPSNSYIKNIRDAGLKYKIYTVEVKGKLYNKVLIGPYSSRSVAKENIENIKKKLNLSSAYVLKF